MPGMQIRESTISPLNKRVTVSMSRGVLNAGPNEQDVVAVTVIANIETKGLKDISQFKQPAIEAIKKALKEALDCADNFRFDP